MSDDAIFENVCTAVSGSLNSLPNTWETQCAVISVLVSAAASLAKQQPRELRQHWAAMLYEQADKLAE